MKKVFLSYLFCSIFISSHFCFGQTNRLKISSPDKTTLCEFTIDKNGSLKYRVYYQNKPVIIWSSLGLVVNKTHLGKNTVINDVSQRKYNKTFPWPLGENDVIANRFREIKPHYQRTRYLHFSVQLKYSGQSRHLNNVTHSTQ